MKPPSFGVSEFEALKTANIKSENDVESLFGQKIRDELVPYLNQTILSKISGVRNLWTDPRSSSAFSDRIRVYIDSGTVNSLETAAWYIFNNGGRSELQFNVGMDKRWLRVGLAFHLGPEKFGDPEAVKGLFNEFKHAVRTSRNNFEEFVIKNHVEVDWNSDPWMSIGRIPSKQVLNFLLTTPVPTTWIFVGRLLKPNNRKDALILSDPSKLDKVITDVLEGLWDYYLKTQRWGHGYTLGRNRVLKRPAVADRNSGFKSVNKPKVP
jgi:hypothetical protein